MFTLYSIESATLLSERIKLEDGRKAARAARLLSIKTNKRFQPRKIESSDDSTWHKREESRFISGEYTPVHNDLAELVRVYENINGARLFAHVAKKNPALIAYTKDAIKGAQDKQSLLSIEAFIDLLYPEHPYKNEIALSQLTYARALTGEGFKIASTPDDIERVYTNFSASHSSVGGSCMRYPIDSDRVRWPRVDGKRLHPTRVYAAGDLAVAYIENDEGLTIARAIIWPDKKIYSRMYADSDILHNALKLAGYSKSRYYGHDNESIEGARLLVIENDDGDLVAPYVDEIGRANRIGDHLVISRDGEIDVMTTSGATRERDNDSTCECCGEEYSEEDLTIVYTDARAYQSENWCEHCRGNNAFYCAGTQEYYSDSVDYTVINDETYTQRFADNNASYCDYYEEYTFDDMQTVIVDSDGETQQWSESAVSDHAFEYNGKLYSDDVDYERVVTERYSLYMRHGRGTDSKGNYCWRVSNFWYVDKTEKIPTHLIDEGEVQIVETDGINYLVGYVDHYPVSRARLDIDPDVIIVESLAA